MKDKHWCNYHGLLVKIDYVAPIENIKPRIEVSENMKWFYEQEKNPDPYIPPVIPKLIKQPRPFQDTFMGGWLISEAFWRTFLK